MFLQFLLIDFTLLQADHAIYNDALEIARFHGVMLWSGLVLYAYRYI